MNRQTTKEIIRPDVLSAIMLDEIAGRLLDVHEGIVELKNQSSRIEKLLSPKTVVGDIRDIDVEDMYEIIDVKGPGTLHELFFRSLTNDYKVMVVADGDLYHYRLWDWDMFSDMSNYLDYIVAELRGAYYILHLSDIQFSKSLYVYITGDLTMDQIYYKYALGK